MKWQPLPCFINSTISVLFVLCLLIADDIVPRVPSTTLFDESLGFRVSLRAPLSPNFERLNYQY